MKKAEATAGQPQTDRWNFPNAATNARATPLLTCPRIPSSAVLKVFQGVTHSRMERIPPRLFPLADEAEAEQGLPRKVLLNTGVIGESRTGCDFVKSRSYRQALKPFGVTAVLTH